MPRLILEGYNDKEAQIIDIEEWKAARDLRKLKAAPTPEYIDELLRRVMMRLHPEWNEAEYQAWLAEWDEDNEESTG